VETAYTLLEVVQARWRRLKRPRARRAGTEFIDENCKKGTTTNGSLRVRRLRCSRESCKIVKSAGWEGCSGSTNGRARPR
jgi:hypothetical protein